MSAQAGGGPPSPGCVLVTGVAGFLGSHLADRLLAAGHAVVGLDDLSTGSRAHLAGALANPRFRLLERDVTAAGAFADLGAPAAAVVHLAARKIPRYGDALTTLRVNAHGTEQALELARRTGAAFVLASTSDVYGQGATVPFAEDGPCVLGSPAVARWAYAGSKLFAEQLAFAYREAHGVPITILRLFGVYGPREHPSWLGGAPAVFIEAALGGTPLPLHGDGRQTRTFLYVDDAVAALAAAVERPAARGQVINVGATEEIEIRQLAELVVRLAGTGPLRTRLVPYESFTGRPYEDVRRRVPDVRRCAALLGVRPTVSLEVGLGHAIAWHRARAAVEGAA